MTVEFYIFLFVVGVIVGLFSGLLGIGGALLMFPILLYVPGLLGLKEISVHMVTGITSMQTTFGTGASAFFHHKEGNVNISLVIKIGIGIAIGAMIGALSSKFLPGIVLVCIYAFVLFIAAVLLLIHKETPAESEAPKQIKISKYKGILFGFLVGLPSGALGLAGSIVIIPLLNSLFHIPMKVCISSGTHIAFVASFVTFIGKAITGQIEFVSAVIVSISATIGAYIGTKLNKKASPKLLRKILLILILLTFVKLVWDILL